jgi:hypothetical protein
MNRLAFAAAVLAALALTYGGAEVLVRHVAAAGGLKPSIITFVLTLGFALLGPTLLAAAAFFHLSGWRRQERPKHRR